MGELAGKVALVTGGARGLGGAIVEVFLREGAKVMITDVLQDAGSELASRLGSSVRFLKHDVTNESDWHHVIEQTRAQFGAFDILINNAGVVGVYPFQDTTPEIWNRLRSIMETGPYLGMRAAIPGMLKSGGGSIVNIASTNALRGMAQSAAYTAAKHGVLGLTRSLALEYATSGVRINAVCPGAMRTPMLKESFGTQMESFSQFVPCGRLAEPREVAEVVSFLASQRASFCFGAAFVADGGMTVD